MGFVFKTITKHKTSSFKQFIASNKLPVGCLKYKVSQIHCRMSTFRVDGSFQLKTVTKNLSVHLS